jgi:5-formyltetrahydrofolate cyclo-ligase
MLTSKLIRQKIWSRLIDVALPDSRFHLNFADVIPDFHGSATATEFVVNSPAYNSCRYAFITPDNCLVHLRERLIADEVPFVISTYGIRRGFLLVEPGMVPKGHEHYAAWLDGIEHFGRPVNLGEIAARGRFDMMVTGASAVSLDGVRFGKGHGYFDLEWGMFTDIGIVDERTPVFAVVHDVQVVEDKLLPSTTDILVDFIATPSRLIRVDRERKRPHGIKWELLDPEQIGAIPPIQELQRIRGVIAG